MRAEYHYLVLSALSIDAYTFFSLPAAHQFVQ